MSDLYPVSKLVVITDSAASIRFDNSLNGLEKNTLQGAIDVLIDRIERLEALLPEESNSLLSGALLAAI